MNYVPTSMCLSFKQGTDHIPTTLLAYTHTVYTLEQRKQVFSEAKLKNRGQRPYVGQTGFNSGSVVGRGLVVNIAIGRLKRLPIIDSGLYGGSGGIRTCDQGLMRPDV